MGFLSELLGGGDLVKAVGDTVDNLFTSDEERLELKNQQMKAEREFNLKERQILADQNIAQTKINIEEAKSGSFFVAGWRPAIGWVGALALFYQFILYPLLLWLPNVDNPPAPLDYTMLYSLITGMLGIAGMRSFDKFKKTDTKKIKSK
jgi:Holin of 3TMs, for gene-transfer release